MKIKIDQTWISESHPHENFKIYDGILDSYILSDKDINLDIEFDQAPEAAKIFFWERISLEAFDLWEVKKEKTTLQLFRMHLVEKVRNRVL